MIKLKLFIVNISIFLATFSSLSQNNADFNTNFNKDCNLWILDNNTASNYSSDNASAWVSIQTPVNSQIADVYFIDSLMGWASHLQYGALRTTNSGVNWDTISFNDTNFFTGYNGICFINSNVGWAVGGATQIRKTTNGGVNWFKQYAPPVSGILRSIYFINANTGYGIGSKNFPYIPFVCKTTNGGDNWFEISPTVSGAQELNEQFWFNAFTGWVCGYDVLLFTTNGGANFTNLYANVPPSGNGHIALLAIQFINAQTGWMGAANLERNNIYKTTNGGTNWFFQNNPVSQMGMNQINDVKFISSSIGWAVHGTPTSGAIMFTSNGGANWIIEESSVNWFDCLEIYQNMKAWCGSSGGKVWFTIPQDPLGISHNQEIPDHFELMQNYPNPFNPTTHFEFRIANFGFVGLKIFDVLGKEVATLVNEQLTPGAYEVEWNASNYPSGVYYYKLSADEYTETKKMILIK